MSRQEKRRQTVDRARPAHRSRVRTRVGFGSIRAVATGGDRRLLTLPGDRSPSRLQAVLDAGGFHLRRREHHGFKRKLLATRKMPQTVAQFQGKSISSSRSQAPPGNAMIAASARQSRVAVRSQAQPGNEVELSSHQSCSSRQNLTRRCLKAPRRVSPQSCPARGRSVRGRLRW